MSVNKRPKKKGKTVEMGEDDGCNFQSRGSRSKKSRKSADDTRDHFGERSRGKQRRRTPQKKGVQWSAIELIRRWSGAKDHAEYEKRRISSFEVEREGKRWCSGAKSKKSKKSKKE